MAKRFLGYGLGGALLLALLYLAMIFFGRPPLTFGDALGLLLLLLAGPVLLLALPLARGHNPRPLLVPVLLLWPTLIFLLFRSPTVPLALGAQRFLLFYGLPVVCHGYWLGRLLTVLSRERPGRG